MARRADRPFIFHHRWAVPRPAQDVMELLGDPLRYPQWWPAILRATHWPRAGAGPSAGGERAEVRLAGLIPVRLIMERQTDDRTRGILVARLHGDVEGTVRVDVRSTVPSGDARPDTGHCLVAWTQEVTLGTAWMRAVAAVPGGREAMCLSHAVAMRAGRRSLGATALPAR